VIGGWLGPTNQVRLRLILKLIETDVPVVLQVYR